MFDICIDVSVCGVLCTYAHSYTFFVWMLFLFLLSFNDMIIIISSFSFCPSSFGGVYERAVCCVHKVETHMATNYDREKRKEKAHTKYIYIYIKWPLKASSMGKSYAKILTLLFIYTVALVFKCCAIGCVYIDTDSDIYFSRLRR